MQEAHQASARVYTPAELLQISIDNGPVFEPGAQFIYCNTNDGALGVVIARATGQSALQAIRQRLLELHDLARTGSPPGQLSLAQRAVSFGITAAAIVSSAIGRRDPIVDELLAAAASPGSSFEA